MNKLNLINIIGLATLLAFGFQSGHAQNADEKENNTKSWDRFSVSFGGFLASYNSGITFASQQLGLGIQIDIEDGLGIESSQLAFRGKAKYNFGKNKKHSATLGYFGIVRNSKKVLEKELDFDGEIFPLGTEITSEFSLAILRTKYDYAFFQDDRVSLGASFGFFIMPISLRVKGIGNQEKHTQFTAPLPLLGLRSDFKISNKFYLNQSVEVLYLAFTNFTGSLLDLNIVLEHRTFDHIAFGAGINSNRLNFTIKNPDSPIGFFGDISMDYTGMIFYAKYSL